MDTAGELCGMQERERDFRQDLFGFVPKITLPIEEEMTVAVEGNPRYPEVTLRVSALARDDDVGLEYWIRLKGLPGQFLLEVNREKGSAAIKERVRHRFGGPVGRREHPFKKYLSDRGLGGRESVDGLIEVDDGFQEVPYCAVPAYPFPLTTNVWVELDVVGHRELQKLTVCLHNQRNPGRTPPEYYAVVQEDFGDFVVTIDLSTGQATIIELRDVSHLGPQGVTGIH